MAKREPKPTGLCIFCNKGFDVEQGEVSGRVGNVKREGHRIEWFHIACYEAYRDQTHNLGRGKA